MIELNKKKPSNIQIIGVSGTDNSEGSQAKDSFKNIEYHFDDLEKWKDSIYAKIVKKCGSRRYWSDWAKDIADIANRHIDEIKILIKKPGIKGKFNEFLTALRHNLNSSIKESDAIEMLAEHMITKPVFDALFEDYEFVKTNPVSMIMQDMLDVLDEKALDKEQETLDKFYFSVRERAKGIDNAEGKQRIIIELYEQFFKNALPKQVEKLGIVYTPVEVVDFIIKSVNDILVSKFGKSVNDQDVHILDPFTGTGTFVVRLLRSGLIDNNNLLYKYTNEIHANEIVLLAYYIAAINIEETFHDITESNSYTSFEGIVLTDTFAMTEKQKAKEETGTDILSYMFAKNSERAEKQLRSPITVIIGNPPYSVGQKKGNDNNQNASYEFLDRSIANTYVAKSASTNSRNAYETSIKAFRWASDRLGENGVIGFVSNGSYLDSKAHDGFRQCLLEEFNSVYVFNLRGDQRTQGELSKKEGGKIFGSGSRTPVAITILVKKKGVRKDGVVHYYDIGDYLTREQKLAMIADFGSLNNINWKTIVPNDNNDWINQRNQTYINFIALGDKKKKEKESIYNDNYASGISTSRDIWLYGFSKEQISLNVVKMIDFYNDERGRCFAEIHDHLNNHLGLSSDRAVAETLLTNIRSNDPTKISWSRGLFNRFVKNEEIANDGEFKDVSYRPFCKKHLMYNKKIIEVPSKWDSIFPSVESENKVICISGAPLKNSFSVFVSENIQDLHFLENSQSFPLYFYDKESLDSVASKQITFFEDSIDDTVYRRRNAISDNALKRFKDAYGNKVTKEDIFYYLYALLHSNSYRAAYAENLAKEMVRIPLVDKFLQYVDVGKRLMELHLNYEELVDPNSLGLKISIKKEDYSVTKMHFAKNGKDVDKSSIVFNDNVVIENIPSKAYEYLLNGRSPMEWIMECYRVKIDKDSGIIDDPNTYGDDKYVFDLLISSIHVSLRTLDLIESLPEYKEI